jgi:hypothetical protein
MLRICFVTVMSCLPVLYQRPGYLAGIEKIVSVLSLFEGKTPSNLSYRLRRAVYSPQDDVVAKRILKCVLGSVNRRLDRNSKQLHRRK